ncbi:MAG: hypothetical protein WC720_03065 [Candidatus Shapirobacteria bacterium]|jgi:hypothetical protein
MSGKSDRIADLFKKNGGCYLTVDDISIKINLQQSDVSDFIKKHPDRFKKKKNSEGKETFLYIQKKTN